MEQLDERQLAELFRAAADDGPPASFGHSDVVVASRRATARRRVALAGGSALGVAVLLGGVLTVGGLFGGSERDGMTAATGGSGQSETNPQLEQAPEGGKDRAGQPIPPPGPQSTMGVPGEMSQDSAVVSGLAIPWPGLGPDDVRTACGPADRELAVALATELPAAAGVEPGAVPDACPPGARAIAVPVMADQTPGWIYVVLGPVRGDGPADQPVQRAEDGARGYQKYTPQGQVLVVLSVPGTAGGQPPFAADTTRLAVELGSRY